jgi:predicted SAM-dependent methyltransferase
MLKINLCSGNDIRNGYLNIDIRKLDPRILQLDIEKELLRAFPNESVSEILANDCIEHISWRVVPDLIKDIYRVLECRGLFTMRVPDLEEIARLTFAGNPGYSDFLRLSYWIFGNQDYPENTHKAGFTKAVAKKLLEDAGFKILNLKSEGTNLVIVGRKECPDILSPL